MIFSETWLEHLEHLEEVFKCQEAADLKIKYSKHKIFKTQVHYLGFLVRRDDVQPLPENVAAKMALEPPKDINKLRQFSGLVGFYRKLIPFFADVTACLNTILRKGSTFQWTKQCNNAFKLLKPELVKMATFQYPNPNKQFQLFTDPSKYNYSGILHQEEIPKTSNAEANLIPHSLLFRFLQ